MPQSIAFNNGTFLDASAIVGLKGTLSDSASIDTLIHGYENGSYYCSNNAHTPTPYGILTVFAQAMTGGVTYQFFISSSNGLMYTRYYNGSAWRDWYVYTGFAPGFGMNIRTVATW